MTTFTSAHLQKLISQATTLTSTQKAMLHAACRWIDWHTLEFWPSSETWAKLASLSTETIRKHCRKLESIGVLSVQTRSRGGRSQSNRYRLNPSALTAEEPTLFGAVVCDQKPPTSSRETPNVEPRNPQRRAAKPPTTLPLPLLRTLLLPPQPPRACETAPDSQPANAGGGRGGDSQSRKREDTPAATPVRPVESAAPSTDCDVIQGTPRASEAINAPGANPVVEALVALSVPRAEAAELAKLPHATLAVVNFVAESVKRSKATINRPARWVARLVRIGPDHLEGWSEYERKLQRTLIASAREWAFANIDDAVYGEFIFAALTAIAPHFGEDWRRTIAEGNLHPSVIRPDATSAEVLASLAASCGVDLSIPTDTLRMPEAAPRTGPSRGATHAL